MIPAPKPTNELERISALHEYHLLDTISEKEYDDITKIAADICGVPISLISLIDTNRQWFKSRVGLDVAETHRDHAFCAYAILSPDEMLVVDNPSIDERFHDNPLVTGAPHIAFYAGVPLVNEEGNALGTLCVLDNKPRQLSAAQEMTLKALARQIVAQLETRKKNIELQKQKERLVLLTNDLSEFAHVVAHDVKSPVSSLAMTAAYLNEKYSDVLDSEGAELLRLMEVTCHSAIDMVNGILGHTLAINQADITRKRFKFGSIFDEIKKTLSIPSGFTISVADSKLELYSSWSILTQILLNLCNNAIKYNDKENGMIWLSAQDLYGSYSFSVRDNGPGIARERQASVFDMFKTLGIPDRYNKMGTGIGLSTVKRLVEKLGGTIEIRSESGNGCEFIFTIDR